jgi:type I restriction enzyme, R subunit
MRITGDSTEGKAELDNFIDPESRFPVIATTSDLMTTGVDARTCKLIVLDKTINSMTTFKQIIGRGTRILEEYNKFFFTIMDFKKATTLFNDPDFDGEPVVIYEPGDDDVDPVPPDPGEDTDDEDDDEGKTGGGEQKFHVGGLPVRIIAERVEYVGPDGKLITESYREFAKKQVQKEFASRTR